MNAMEIEINFPHLSAEHDRHGNPRLYVRRYGRRIRLRMATDAPGFTAAYQAAIDRLKASAPVPKAAPEATWPKGSFGELANDYFAVEEFTELDAISQRTRRQVIEGCLQEPHSDSDPDHIGNCPVVDLTSKLIKRLRDLKRGKPGAANNRKKYLSAMFGWAIEADRMGSNPARDVKRKKYTSSGYYTWTVQDVIQFQQHHPIGTKPMLALALLLYTGSRKGDVVKFGESMIRNEVLKFVPGKTKKHRPAASEKPVLPALRRIIELSQCGTDTFLETGHGKPFTANGFGNWFREQCDKAYLPKCTAHGLRKIGATIAAENQATVHQLMAIFDWSTMRQAETYTRAASQKKLAQNSMHLIQPVLSLPAPEAVH